MYGPFEENLGKIMDSVTLHHIKTEPFPPTLPTEAPCIEFATFYNVEEDFLKNLESFGQAVDTGKPDGLFGYAIGEVIEQLTGPKEGAQEGAAIVFLVGW